MGASFAILAGLMMGLASSLHCAGMCGSIGSALLMAAHPGGGTVPMARTLLVTQAGRVLAYATAGSVVGLFGTGVATLFDRASAFEVLRWASAVTLVGIGLSTARILPALAGFDRLAAPLGGAVMTLSVRLPGLGPAASLATGILWGFMPCAMVYGALFAAMLQASAAGSAAFMFGFGLGTLPAVIFTALGLSSLRELARDPRAARAIGLAIAGFGVLSVLIAPAGTVLCLPLSALGW
jgi:sulfite exporter TauE/SafE